MRGPLLVTLWFPRDLLIPPEQFALLSSIIVSSAGNQSLLTYLQTNTISYHQNGCSAEYPRG
ncbi:bacteriophage protein [Escherichia coli]|nr:bacteriophage protein [Escherichia coli]